MRKLITSGSPYENSIGFSRAVRSGRHIAVSGTGPISSDGSSACIGDAYGQARRCLEIIKTALDEAGGSLNEVIRTRIYITDISVWEEVGKAHGEFFADIKPASTLVVVSNLIRPEWFVEIEADAILAE